ncbi:shikimate kinase [Petroclostridium sp. X23]|uniref:shikimate kinase n=1 Tax=Petroclostridium sp. X23 TaxID=3045146 RepID=UPI0024AE1B2E|nr:shikimate kinase [Petroclostridium sp. X23]WHH59652.1 shikimate kinase [Petroclostridium sp. X23]
MNKNIVLTGFMGSGKTTVGKIAAEKLNMIFIDVDAYIENEQQKKISDIFEQFGEEYFRNLETDMVKKVALEQNAVIATGGGVVLRKENLDYLRQNGVIVYLYSNEEAIMRNTSHNTDRPLLKGPDAKARIAELLKKRAAFYSNHDFKIDVSMLTVEQAVEAVLNIYGQIQAK